MAHDVFEVASVAVGAPQDLIAGPIKQAVFAPLWDATEQSSDAWLLARVLQDVSEEVQQPRRVLHNAYAG